ncbi:MAG: sigma-70 family RNA polymerase sigma factor [Rikenellaceae bacterium]
MKQPDDKDIIALCTISSTKDRGFAILVDKYKEQIYWHIRRMIVSHENSEDVFQETMINVYKYLSKFRGDSSLYTWIYRIATNECIKFLNRNKTFGPSDGVEMLENIAGSAHSYDENKLIEKFQQAILSLPVKQQLVFNLRYYDQASYAQIAEITGSSVESLKTNYHYAEKKIKDIMTNSDL